MTKTDMHAHFIARLRAARTAVGLSQTALGMRMGLTKDIASTRINRYETGASEPDLRTAERMAKELGVSLSWLVCTDPKMADMIDGFAKLDAAGQDALLGTLHLVRKRRLPSTQWMNRSPSIVREPGSLMHTLLACLLAGWQQGSDAMHDTISAAIADARNRSGLEPRPRSRMGWQA